MQVALAALRDVAAIETRFRTGDGFGWHEHDAGLFVGTERFFRPGYVANLVAAWLPALDGVDRQARGRRPRSPTWAADTARRRCSWPQAFPRSTFLGVDYHEASIAVARRRAAERRASPTASPFEVADAAELPPAAASTS